jgi:hypothetical protein
VGDMAGLEGGVKAHLHLDSILDRPAGKRNPLIDLVYDFQTKHHQMT